MKNGPVTAIMKVHYTMINGEWEGFPTSVYHSIKDTSQYVGPHAVKIVGWGTMTDGTAYWIVSLSA